MVVRSTSRSTIRTLLTSWPSRLVGGAALLGGVFALGNWYGERRVRLRDEFADGRLLSSAIDSVRANAIDSLPNDELIRRAMSGMLRELQDPYAALLRPDSYQRYRGALLGETQGMGFSLRRQAGSVTITRVAPNSPAAAAGARNGDRVLSVNGIPIADGWGRARGDTSSVPLTLARIVVMRAPDGDTTTLSLTRGAWHTTAISDAAMLTDSLAYVRLSSITSKSPSELEDVVDSLRGKGATSLVLDLRGNAGGLFEEGVKIAGLFLPRGVVIASLDGRRGQPADAHLNHRSRWPSMPITLLVDGGTASAAEVIAAGLRDHGRALLVGTPTYGKGVVQRVVTLTPELSLKLTTARWMTPKGESLTRRKGEGAEARGGMMPDVLLDDAARRDPFFIPRDWPLRSQQLLSAAADSAVVTAVRANWPVASVTVLEQRLREEVGPRVPSTVRGELARTEWTNLATQVATARMLELQNATGALLRYSARGDAALRAGVDVLMPGTELVSVSPSATAPAGASRVGASRVGTSRVGAPRAPSLRDSIR